MAGIKLIYFDARGTAEISRLILAAAGQQFEDIRVKADQWEAGKSSK